MNCLFFLFFFWGGGGGTWLFTVKSEQGEFHGPVDRTIKFNPLTFRVDLTKTWELGTVMQEKAHQ